MLGDFLPSSGRCLTSYCAEVVDMSFGTTRHLCHYKVLDFGRLADVRKLYYFWGLFIRLTMIYDPQEGTAGNPYIFGAGTMSLYHSMAFSDLEVCFLRLNFWWSCINRHHQDDSPIFVRNKKSPSHFSKDTRQEEAEFSLSNRPSQKSTFLVASSICRMVVLWWSRSTTWRPGFRWSVWVAILSAMRS